MKPTLLIPLMLAVAPAAFGQGATLKEKYSVRVKQTALAPAEFTLKINGEVVGSYSDDAQVDVTDRLKPGKNTFVVVWKASAPIKNQFASSSLTIGVYRNGRWSTAMNVAAKKALPKGTRTVTLTAR